LFAINAAGQTGKSDESMSTVGQLIAEAGNLVKVATNFDTVNVLLNRAEKLIRLPRDSHESIRIRLIRGMNELNKNNYEKAVQTYFDALDDAELTGDSAMVAQSYYNLGKIFNEMEDYDEAISYFRQAIAISQNACDTTLLAKSFQNIAISYQHKNEIDKALAYNKKVESLALVRKDTAQLIDVTNNLGTIAYEQKDLPKALTYYQRALDLYRKKNNQQGIATAFNNIGLINLDNKKYDQALVNFKQALALANKLKMYDLIGDIYSNLTVYYATLEDYKNAYTYYHRFNTVYDSIAGEKKTKMIRIIQAKYQLQKTHRDLNALQEKNQVQRESINNARWIQFFLMVIIVVIILLMISTVFFLVREKKMARALKAKTQELLESNQTKDKFFSIVAHDLRNPFNVLVGYTNLLKTNFDSFSTDEVRQIISDLNSAAENGFNLLQNLLLWSRTQTNRLHVFKTHFNLLQIVNQVEEVVDLNLAEKNQQLTIEVNPQLTLYADKDMISTVLRNLLFNAIKFSPKGSGIILKSTEEKDHVRIDVIDSGIGIDDETRGKLFGLNFSSSAKGTEGESGSGLGLVICKEFIEMNAGKIWVESVPGKGSVFSFTVPLKTE
jgi:signal transduction histidine kinase